MPHTTRKKKQKPSHEKRLEFTDPDGWTHVTRGSKREPPDVEERRFKELTFGLGSMQTSDLTMEALLDLHRLVDEAWRASQCCQELISVLQDKVLTSDAIVIDRAICTGLGSISSAGSYVSRAKSMWQLVAFESVMVLLKTKHEIKAVNLQDPRFNDLDRDFFTNERGFLVLRDPEAIQHMSTTTFLFAPCNEFTLLQRAFDAAFPVLFLGNDIGDYLLHSTLQTGTSNSLERFLLGSKGHRVMHQQKLPLSSSLQLGTLHWRASEIEPDGLAPSSKPAAPQMPETLEGPPSLKSAV